MDNFEKFSFKEFENQIDEINKNLDKKNHKDRKIIHVRLIQYLINFFKSEYPTLNRHPLKDLLSYLVEVDVKNKDFNSSKNETKIISKFSRKKKADTLIVAALELLIEHGYDEKDAILNATKIIKSKKEIYFHKLLNLYRSNLLHPNLKILLSDLKQEAKKRSDIENAASIYFEKAFQNLK